MVLILLAEVVALHVRPIAVDVWGLSCDDPQPYYSLSHIWDNPQLLSVMLQLY